MERSFIRTFVRLGAPLVLTPNVAHSIDSSNFDASLSVASATGPTPRTRSRSIRKDQVTELVEQLSHALKTAVREIHSVNAETKVLALNARIESARAGSFGAAFGIVAEEMQQLSERTSQIADNMSTGTQNKTNELLSLINSQILGSRLSDQALMNIDLIDRCLYERTCDVRWWATDSALVSALSSNQPETIKYASHRLGVILSAYTVYFDLVLCDVKGKVIANGRPDSFSVVGRDESQSLWFQEAMRTSNGNEFGFQSAHTSHLVKMQPTVIYSAAVRENAETNGRAIGALGILFNWDSLASAILNKVAGNDGSLECYIIDQNERVLASNIQEESQRFRLNDFDPVRAKVKGHFVHQRGSQRWCVAHAKAPGFETYSTGWYSLVIQRID